MDFGKIYENKWDVLRIAFERFIHRNGEQRADYRVICEKQSYWLEDYALFSAIKKHYEGKPWFEWDRGAKFREGEALHQLKSLLQDEIAFQKFMQYEFFKQWQGIKAYANKNNIQIIGDIPMYVAHDSCDAWAHPEVFCFDEALSPLRVSGVPPDYFMETGQLWGNPVFRWDYLRESDFEWWIDRIRINYELYDIIRFDHFRAFAAFWSIPYGESTAINGEWVKAYGDELFAKILKCFPTITIIAEDLGLITEDVIELIRKYDFTSMKILQFAFDTDEGSSGFLPHQYQENTFVYTGALDNDTVKGWFFSAKVKDQAYLCDYVRTNPNEVVWDLIKTAFGSVSRYAATTMQDLLVLGSEARMNTPGIANGNWGWRYKKEYLKPEIAEKLKYITTLYGR